MTGRPHDDYAISSTEQTATDDETDKGQNRQSVESYSFDVCTKSGSPVCVDRHSSNLLTGEGHLGLGV